MGRDSVLGTLTVATVLCVACALLVSSARVVLRERQEANKELDRKRNILAAAGLVDEEVESKEIDQIFAARVKEVLVDLDKAEVVSQVEGAEKYDSREILDDPQQTKPITVDGP